MAGHQILLVDDDGYQREALTILLQLQGYVVETADDGSVALDLLRTGFRPCVIVLDMSMPTMSGEEFRREQMGDPALCDIPVILYSSGDELAHAARRMGVAAHASKPATDELLQLVAAHC
jgi:CheY-like chemotaxis protein